MNSLSYNIKSRDKFQISNVIQIQASQKKIWEIITEPGHLKNFHPFCEKHKRVKWEGIGDRDAPQLYSGKITYRKIIKWEKEKGFQIEMDNGDGNITYVEFYLVEVLGPSIRFGIDIKTDSYRKIPRFMWNWFARKKLIPSYEIYLYSILNGLKYFAETGIPVKRNQFGSHPKFSPKIKNK